MFQRSLGPQSRRPTHSRPTNHRAPGFRPSTGSGSDSVSDRLSRDPALARLEAALFLAQEPIPLRKLVNVAGLKDSAEARRLIDRLRDLHDADGTAFRVNEIAGGYQLFTRPMFQPWLVRANRVGTDPKLTPALLETLAVVAHRQPIMRADVEGIRGVGCGEMLTQLMERGLVKIVGRHESLGRPILFGTTKRFLQVFGLNSLEDLKRDKSLE
ncbi:SMC-Scp complex subunit ScpB [Zavarzinella formosa]|uniref:SMC-Scp complex subunit ScpB n=1 Tax=Zavarzinella formosa TaxID=360055 RepID=UPI0002F89425|nr:SMC-Scp complex subunit ScpB [Zavarzinella formosa]